VKIATYNVNGINGRLPVLLRWLEDDAPDIVCLQELKSPDERFPRCELQRGGYEAVWHGQKSWNGVAILARGATPFLTRRSLPGDPDDSQSRYIEAVVDGIVIGCLYLPNGNPAPGPKFDYKLHRPLHGRQHLRAHFVSYDQKAHRQSRQPRLYRQRHRQGDRARGSDQELRDRKRPVHHDRSGGGGSDHWRGWCPGSNRRTTSIR